MIDFIAGLVIGGIASLVFYWYLGIDADEKYQGASSYAEAGEKAYRDALQVLEVNRTERLEHNKQIDRIWLTLMRRLEMYLPSDVMKELKSLMHDSCTKETHEDQTDSI